MVRTRLPALLVILLLLSSTAPARSGLPNIPCLNEQSQCSGACFELGIGTQAYFECICECALDLCLCLQELDQVPEDIDACVEELDHNVCESAFPPGLAEDNPILPNSLVDGVYTFIDAPTGFWFDPPFTASLLYETTDAAKFLQITGFPTGFTDPFDVYVGEELVGSFQPGDVASFVGRGGVTSFVVSGISPEVDTASETAFPLRIVFDQATADFTMRSTTLPEPGAAAGTLATLAVLVGLAQRRRRPGA